MVGADGAGTANSTLPIACSDGARLTPHPPTTARKGTAEIWAGYGLNGPWPAYSEIPTPKVLFLITKGLSDAMHEYIILDRDGNRL